MLQNDYNYNNNNVIIKNNNYEKHKDLHKILDQDM